MFGNHGLCGLLEEGAHGKSPKCLGGNLGDFGEFCKGLGFYEFDNPPSDILDLVIENKPVKPSSDGIGDFLDAVILKEGKKHNG